MLVLASASPRRRELLQQILTDFEVAESGYHEAIKGLGPKDYAIDCAYHKALKVFLNRHTDVVMGADTVVVLNGKILGKPVGATEAREMLFKLSGKSHSVITGVALIDKSRCVRDYEESIVSFNEFNHKEIEEYIKSGSPFDKAGGYGIQDGFIKSNVRSVNGSLDNVIGLPLNLTKRLLIEFGLI